MPTSLHKLATTIRSFIESEGIELSSEAILDEDEEGEEGRILTRTHNARLRAW
jgi:hypothetical protein